MRYQKEICTIFIDTININYIVTAVRPRLRPEINYLVIINYKILIFPLYRLIKLITSL